ncbi:MAG: hypothetical protein VX252_01555 [Myxococcota bacterium]|nr:hypothetical protein [Myxococcota bacterium]
MAARVEATRRSDGAHRARQMAEAELAKAPDSHPARIALALALLDLEDPHAARGQLRQYLDSLVAKRGTESVKRDELSSLEASTEPAPSALSRELSAAWAGEEALSSGSPEPASETGEVNVDASRRSQARARGESLFGTTSSFATQTMAGLLDRQGDHKRADVIRESLDDRMAPEEEKERAADTEEPAEDQRVIQTLQAWLRNVERSEREL